MKANESVLAVTKTTTTQNIILLERWNEWIYCTTRNVIGCHARVDYY